MMDQNMMQAMSTLQQENGIAKMMLEPVYATGVSEEPNTSQAELVADLFNIERLDTKALADAVGAEISIQRMTPETAAVLLQQMVRQESLELIDKFNELEDQREAILHQLLDEDELEEHRQLKESVAYSVPDDEPAAEGTPEPADEVPTEAPEEVNIDADPEGEDGESAEESEASDTTGDEDVDSDE